MLQFEFGINLKCLFRRGIEGKCVLCSASEIQRRCREGRLRKLLASYLVEISNLNGEAKQLVWDRIPEEYHQELRQVMAGATVRKTTLKRKEPDTTIEPESQGDMQVVISSIYKLFFFVSKHNWF